MRRIFRKLPFPLNILEAISNALSPLTLIIDIPAFPTAVDTAAIVSLSRINSCLKIHTPPVHISAGYI